MSIHDTGAGAPYEPMVSLSALWKRWQEIEALGASERKQLAEMDAIEKKIVYQPAESAADLLAKLKFLAMQARDHDWNDQLEHLFTTIETGWCDLIGKQDAWTRLEQAIFDVRGAAECLMSVEHDGPEEMACSYLGARLLKHADAADAAFTELVRERHAKRDIEVLSLAGIPASGNAE